MTSPFEFRPGRPRIGPQEALIPLSRGLYAVVDLVDAELGFRGCSWVAQPSGRTLYAVRRPVVEGRQTVERLHRLVAERMGLDIAGKTVDHIDGDGLNCRRSNLRAATIEENQRNTGPHAHNKSGVKGVDRCKGKWRAQIKVGGRTVHLGYFEAKEAAANAYAEAAARHHGEFARLR